MGRSPLGHVGRVVFDSVADAGRLSALGHGPRVLLEVEKVTGTASRSAVCRVDRTCPTRPITRTRKPAPPTTIAANRLPAPMAARIAPSASKAPPNFSKNVHHLPLATPPSL